MRFRVLLLFVVTPLIEVLLLVRIGRALGLWPTVLLVLATGVLGGMMARSQGLATWRRFQTSWASGRVPADEIIDGVIILVSAVLLLTPGVLTDLAGFLGLLPPARARLRRVIENRVTLRAYGSSASDGGGPREAERGSGWTGQAKRQPGHGLGGAAPHTAGS